ncbi:hypothetical protein DEHALATV1_0068 [Dehalococcoides mccartyi]|uniref:Uncharacterized protein n=1 Tax=Dehalococcoides mccartyi TaxID=61435 RepID=A0AB33HQF3_9CHLR|nr:hypothetical protein IBK_0092 [Dehalococcoides mccartyi IBARAKI]BAZ96696.1 hypothetical protein DEHALATV1_0068 [Dehalococcoides mccartyi]
MKLTDKDFQAIASGRLNNRFSLYYSLAMVTSIALFVFAIINMFETLAVASVGIFIFSHLGVMVWYIRSRRKLSRKLILQAKFEGLEA